MEPLIWKSCFAGIQTGEVEIVDFGNYKYYSRSYGFWETFSFVLYDGWFSRAADQTALPVLKSLADVHGRRLYPGGERAPLTLFQAADGG